MIGGTHLIKRAWQRYVAASVRGYARWDTVLGAADLPAKIHYSIIPEIWLTGWLA
jgi:hypothetical protein